MVIDKLRQAQGNNLSDTLSTSIGSTDTTIPVNTISIWSANGGKVIIDRGLSTQEIVYCSGVSGSSLVVQAGGRGQEGTTGQGHNVGAAIESVPTAGDWNDLVTSVENVLVQSTGALDTTKVVDLTTAQTLTNKKLSDTTTTIVNVSDATKVLKFDPSGATTGTTMTIASPQTAGRTLTLPDATDTLVGRATTDTLTNKRRTRRVVTTTQSATPTINTDNTDVAVITGLAQAITSFTTNLSGTPVDGDLLEIDITDNGTARALTFGASFAATTIALPTTTVISTKLNILFKWSAADSKWLCVAVA